MIYLEHFVLITFRPGALTPVLEGQKVSHPSGAADMTTDSAWADPLDDWPLSEIDVRVGQRIASLRLQLGETARCFARRLGMSESELASLESGQRHLRAAEFATLHRVFNLPPGYLFAEAWDESIPGATSLTSLASTRYVN